MNTFRKVLVGLHLGVLLLIVGGMVPASAGSPIAENNGATLVQRNASLLANGLTELGYEVTSGYLKLYTQDDCPYSYEVLHSCLGNNPAAPYVIPIVPPWPDEWVDPGTAGMVGPTVEGYNASYRLDPREAIVIFGRLPPPARYLGLQTYLLSRPGEWDEGSAQYLFVKENIPALLNTFFTKLPKNDDRLEIFADLSDPINNVVIENQSGAVWDTVRAFVITPDETMNLSVRQALAGLGVPDDAVFTEQIPSQLGDTNMAIGLDEGADDFLTVLRYAMPEDGGADGTPSDTWRKQLPLVVLRIRDSRPSHEPQPYPWVEFEARYGTTPPEIGLAPDLGKLAKSICSRWNQPCDLAPLLNLKASKLSLTGPACVKVGMNCIAPNEDVVYFMSKRLWLPGDRVYAALGALGTQTDNATYVGLGLNSSVTQLGFDNIDDTDLVGSADGYDVPNHDRFFLQYFARDCKRKVLKSLTAGSPCYSIGDQLPVCSDPNDLTCSELVLSVRDYLLPGSERGPKPELTLNPLVITLQPDRLWLPLVLH